MTSQRLPILVVVTAVCLLGAPPQADATAIANSTLDFKNLAITPAAGTFTLDGPWFLQAFAEADNSLGERVEQTTPNLPPDFLAISPATVRALAKVTWAEATGSASAPNHPADPVVTGSAKSDVNIPGCGPAFASSKGRGTMFNVFTLTGGGSSVDVQFEIDISGLLRS